MVAKLVLYNGKLLVRGTPPKLVVWDGEGPPPADCCCGDCCESLPDVLCARREWLTGCLAGSFEDFDLVKSAPGIWGGAAPEWGSYTFACQSAGGTEQWVLTAFGCPTTSNVKNVETGATCNPVFAEYIFTYVGSDFACPTMSCGFFVGGSYKVTVQNCPEMLMAMASRSTAAERRFIKPLFLQAWENKPGSQLERMLNEIDAKAYAGCGCESLVAQMNAWGVEGCREHRSEIAAKLEENAGKLNLLQIAKMAGKVAAASWLLAINPLDRYGSLVDEAIRRSERAQLAI